MGVISEGGKDVERGVGRVIVILGKFVFSDCLDFQNYKTVLTVLKN